MHPSPTLPCACGAREGADHMILSGGGSNAAVLRSLPFAAGAGGRSRDLVRRRLQRRGASLPPFRRRRRGGDRVILSGGGCNAAALRSLPCAAGAGVDRVILSGTGCNAAVLRSLPCAAGAGEGWGGVLLIVRRKTSGAKRIAAHACKALGALCLPGLQRHKQKAPTSTDIGAQMIEELFERPVSCNSPLL